MKKMNKLEIEFLDHSNRIEREYSREALEDAIGAWNYAKINMDNFNLDYILEIHKMLLYRLRPDIAGKVRDCGVSVGRRVCPKKPKGDLERDVEKWIANCRGTKGNDKQIKEWHIEFEKIHPFKDGNGRVGRILMNIQRLNYNLPLLVIHEGEEQLKYYEWFKNA